MIPAWLRRRKNGPPEAGALGRLADAPPPGPLPDGTRAVIILASQRCGSTLISEDVEATGRMGLPKEHMLPLMRAEPEAELPELFPRGLQEGCFGMKLMTGQLAALGAYLDTPARARALLDQDDRAQLAVDCVNGLRVRFASVTWLSISRRDRFAQAYSRLRARATGIYHRRESGPQRRRPPQTVEITPQTLHDELTRIAADDALFAELCARTGIRPLHTVYEDYLAAPDRHFAAIAAHAGLELARPAARERRTEKIVASPELEAARAAYEQRYGAGSAAPMAEESGPCR
ncbi:Stf0 family sulfotransferase [Oceanicella sp. SM1341]|uniref:Stf0 family sulfotransferase n=1 Tax=Oceanicella sp. SM1341 TaxID=1548889 RepID=UPI000E4894C1|nr:Stf0 family sulfotransferase [Oceanicella sp. SM1341]